MLAYVKENNVKSAAVIGGGLLGLEAAKAVADMKVESHIIEFAPILMCRQIDQGGHDALVGKIEEMGLKVHCGARTESFVGQGEFLFVILVFEALLAQALILPCLTRRYYG
jgi:nitrite reductase (NADH) large subunit